MKTFVTFLLLILLTTWVEAQDSVKIKNEFRKPTGFNKKVLLGVSLQQYWTTISGSSLPEKYFSKPSTGGLVNVEYYPLSFLGFGLGAGFQQRGAGIYHQNTAPVTATGPDSTYRYRLRFSTLEMPLSIIFRTPKDLLPGFRISGSISAVAVYNLHSRIVYSNLEPSIKDTDTVKDVSSAYFKNDLPVQFSIGPEFASGTGIFKLQFVVSQGTANVYKASQATGHNHSTGVRLAVLF
jgi:hypothetical protein